MASSYKLSDIPGLQQAINALYRPNIWKYDSGIGHPIVSIPTNAEKSTYGQQVSQLIQEYTKRYEQQKLAEKLYADWQKSYNEAKQANETRYDAILKGYDDLAEKSLAQLEGYGEAEKSTTRKDYSNILSKINQQMVNTGLFSSTVAPAAAIQNERSLQEALAAINERLQGQKVGITTSLGQEKLGVMERREDTYPDIQSYYQLLLQAGGA